MGFALIWSYTPHDELEQGTLALYLNLGPRHTWDWEPVTITLQALSSVEKAELLQVQAPHYAWGTDGVYKWTQDGRKVHMASNGTCYMVTWTILKKPPLRGRPKIKPGDHDTLHAHNHSFILFYHVWGPAWIEPRWNSIQSRAKSHTASHSTLRVRDHTTWVWRCVGTSFGHFLLGSQNFTDIMALRTLTTADLFYFIMCEEYPHE